MNELATSINCRHRRPSLIALIYISTVVFWYSSNRIPSIKEQHNKYSTRVVPLASHHHNNNNNRISVSLHKAAAADSGYYTRFSLIQMYKCGDEQGKQPLPPTLQKYFNFIASIKTDLKIIFIGDSVGAQFAQAFDSAVLDVGQEDSVRATQTFIPSSNRPEWVNLCMSISFPIRGGGVSAFWRMTHLMLRETNSWPFKCQQVWRHWNEGQGLAFLNHEYNSTKLAAWPSNSGLIPEFWQKTNLASWQQTNLFNTGNIVNKFDVVILRPTVWLQIDYINNATRIIETIETTHRILGATTIVITTLPLFNNVDTENDWKSVAEINRMIREVARNITESDGAIEYVLVQEFGNLTNQVLMENAKHLDLISLHRARAIDYSHEGWEVDLADVFLQRPPKKSAKDWPSSHCQVCSSFPSNATETCPGVRISSDGVHWCVETFGARFTASIACLLGCVYNNVFKPPTHEGVRECEQQCNDQFMSLSVVGDEMFKN